MDVFENIKYIKGSLGLVILLCQLQGMVYLHKSVFQSHGYLSSANCHVDSRWVLKVSGFALHAFRIQDSKEQVSELFMHRSAMTTSSKYLQFQTNITFY